VWQTHSKTSRYLDELFRGLVDEIWGYCVLVAQKPVFVDFRFFFIVRGLDLRQNLSLRLTSPLASYTGFQYGLFKSGSHSI
jgi:hypothetical protein